jgi:phenylpropionate dioxygenase-like ring-hydroxylating dioxygenase large terminal subunit
VQEPTSLTTGRTAANRHDDLRHRALKAGMNPNYWYPAEHAHRVPRGGVCEVVFQKQSIAIYRGQDGRLGAMENRCAHRHIKLTLGHVKQCDLVCIYHGWHYDRDGRLVQMEHDHFGKKLPKIQLRRYPVRERYGLIWIFPGTPELADQVPLPEILHADGPDRWASLSFDYTWRAHHSMIIDNLCNLTHFYTHGNWVPYGKTHLAHHGLEHGERIELTWRSTLRRDVSWLVSKHIFLKPGHEDESDTEMVYDYPYQTAVSNRRIRSCNFMLPIDDEHTRVFTMQLWQGPEVAGRRVPPGAMQLLTPFISPITREIFRQDGVTVEAEQEAMEAHFHRPLPEPNPSVKLFNQVTVEKWDQYLAAEAAGDPLASTQTRTKVL